VNEGMTVKLAPSERERERREKREKDENHPLPLLCISVCLVHRMSLLPPFRAKCGARVRALAAAAVCVCSQSAFILII